MSDAILGRGGIGRCLQGNPGGKTGIKYKFSTSTSISDPGSGFLSFDSSTHDNVSKIFINSTDATRIDQSNLFDAELTSPTGYLYIAEDVGDRINIYYVESVICYDYYFEIGIVVISGQYIPALNDRVSVLWIPIVVGTNAEVSAYASALAGGYLGSQSDFYDDLGALSGLAAAMALL